MLSFTSRRRCRDTTGGRSLSSWFQCTPAVFCLFLLLVHGWSVVWLYEDIWWVHFPSSKPQWLDQWSPYHGPPNMDIVHSDLTPTVVSWQFLCTHSPAAARLNLRGLSPFAQRLRISSGPGNPLIFSTIQWAATASSSVIWTSALGNRPPFQVCPSLGTC